MHTIAEGVVYFCFYPFGERAFYWRAMPAYAYEDERLCTVNRRRYAPGVMPVSRLKVT